MTEVSDPRMEIEREAETLQEELKSLVADRIILQEKFTHLTELEGELNIQLRDDSLASEGHLHSFHFEKKDVEEQLQSLEKKLAEKMNRIRELDEKASEYLMKVTSDSNSVYDEDEGNEEETNEDQKNLIEKLLYEDMVENEDMSDSTETGSCDTDTEGPLKKPSTVKEENVVSENQAGASGKNVESTPILCTTEDIISLSTLVSELKKVKEDMGQQKKEGNLNELEDQLQSTRQELEVLKESMITMSNHLRVKEDESVRGSRQSLARRRMGSSSRYSSVSDASSDECFGEIDALDELLATMEPRFPGDDDSPVDFDRGSRMNDYRSPSVNCISERVAMLEQNLIDSTEALKNKQKQVWQLLRERKHKDKECEELQSKVKMVESKMSELQNTFDALIRAIMTEKEEYAKEVAIKNEKLKSLEENLTEVQEKLGEEGDNNKIEEIESQFRDDIELLQSQMSVMKENHDKEKEILINEHKNSIIILEKELVNLKTENESNLSLPTEIQHLKEELSTVKKELEDSVASQDIKNENDKSAEFETLSQELQSHKEEGMAMIEILKQQLEEQQQQIEEINAKNVTLTSEMYTKEEEYNEELNAREATIQELRITLTNNQKQSRENFQMAQDDVASLQMKLQTEQEETKAIITLLKEKVVKLEDDLQIKQEECETLQGCTLIIGEGSNFKTEEKPINEGNEEEQSNQTHGYMAEQKGLEEVKPPEATSDDANKKCPVSENGEIQNFKEEIKKLEESLNEKSEKVTELEKKLETSQNPFQADPPDQKILMDKQLEQIQELNIFIEELKQKLNESEKERQLLKNTVDKIESGGTEDNVTTSEVEVASSSYDAGKHELSNAKKTEINEIEGELHYNYRTEDATLSDKSSENVHGNNSSEKNNVEESVQNENTADEKKKVCDEKDLEEKKSLIKNLEKKLFIIESSLCDPNIINTLSFVDRVENVKKQLEERIIYLDSHPSIKASKTESEHKCCKCGMLMPTKDQPSSDITTNKSKQELNSDKVLREVASTIEPLDQNDTSNLVKTEPGKNVEKVTNDAISSSITTADKDEIKSIVNFLNEKVIKLENDLELKREEYNVLKNSVAAQTDYQSDETDREKNQIDKEAGEQKQVGEGTLKVAKETDLDSDLQGVDTVEHLTKQLKKIKSQNKKLLVDKKLLTKNYEMEQEKTLEMQNQMVNDMEGLILNLEADKEQLQKELIKLKSQNFLGAIQEEDEDSTVVLQKSSTTPGVIASVEEKSNVELVAITQEMAEKIRVMQMKMDGSEMKAMKELEEERIAHNEQMKNLRKDIREEIDILEQQKEEVAETLSKDMVKVSSDWAQRLEERERELEGDSSEVKAQFGQVLVAKNNEAEKLNEEKNKEIEACQTRMKFLQKKLDNKTNLVEELERNLTEMVIVRSNLEETIVSLKTAKSHSAPKSTTEPITMARDIPDKSELTGAKRKKKRAPSIYEDTIAAQELLRKSSSMSSIDYSRDSSLTPRGAGAGSPDFSRSGACSPHSYTPRPTRPKRDPKIPILFPPVSTSSPSWTHPLPFE